MKKAAFDKDLAKFNNYIVDTIKESLLVLDGEMKVIFANKAFYSTFGVTKKETEYKIIYNLGNGQWNIPELKKLLEEILPKKTTVEGFEVRHDFPKIGEKVMEINARKIDDGGRQMVLVAIEDITEQKKMLEYAIKSAKLSAIGQLSAGIAHGLNSPLTGIQNFLYVYYKNEKKGTQKSKELSLMLEACEYMGEIIKNLTYFSGKDSEKPTKVSLESIIHSTLLFVERQFRVNNIQIKTNYSKNVSYVRGIKCQLQHVFLNLMINAKEAISDGGLIIVSVRENKKKGVVEFEVKDNGKGISKENMEKIFTPFFSTKKKGFGAGLGLSSSFNIIEKHGGEISIESEEGKGTTVIVTLPAVKK